MKTSRRLHNVFLFSCIALTSLEISFDSSFYLFYTSIKFFFNNSHDIRMCFSSLVEFISGRVEGGNPLALVSINFNTNATLECISL